MFHRHVRSGAATPFDVPLPYTGASGPEVRRPRCTPRRACCCPGRSPHGPRIPQMQFIYIGSSAPPTQHT